MASKRTAADIPSQQGKLALVTGANRGLGFEIAVALAGAGARVVIAVRDTARAQQALERIGARVPGAQVEAMPLDLADLASVRDFAYAFAQRHAALDLLVNNASAIMVPLSRTRDGFEMHFGTNHLGHFALTGLLLPQLAAAPAARIVNTASLAHRLTPGLDLDDLLFERRAYKEMDAYGASKLAALLYTFELDRRLRKTRSRMLATVAHPGYSATNVDLGGFFMRLATRLFAQPASHGAWPALYAATAADVKSGEYFGPGGYKELGGSPRRVDCRPEARDPKMAERLWSVSESLTGVRYLGASA
jgi:NAD(P)-dependent dehydrogenase (short-subunit alcohol dehydrogenase family)